MLLCVAGSGPIRAELTETQKKELIRKQHAGSSAQPSGKKKSGTDNSGSVKSSGSAKKGKSTSGSSANAHSGGTKKKKASSSSGQHGNASVPNHHATTATVSAESSADPHFARPSQDYQVAFAGATPPLPPAPIPNAPSLPLPHGAEASVPITIEKSGVEAEQGLEPAPAPEPAHEGFWSRLFGPQKTYAYLTPSVRYAIDHAPVKHGRWKYIVVHNSGTREGNARVFDIYHRRVRHMVNGLAYHFVIGDGHGSGDGQVEIGDRWKRQINGGHVASDYLNDIALGICLVGDFNRDQPTKAQIGALEELVAYLRNRVGKSQGRKAIVHAHKEINPRPTDCPGDRFPYGWLHAKFGNTR